MVTFENLVTTGFFTALLFGVGRAVLAAASRKRAGRRRAESRDDRNLRGLACDGLPVRNGVAQLRYEIDCARPLREAPRSESAQMGESQIQ